MTDFVLHSAEIAAQKTIEQRAMMTLNARDSASFVDAILKPAPTGPVLRAAARYYRSKLGR